MPYIKNIHEKLMRSIQSMMVDVKLNLPYYGHFNLFINFSESDKIPTCGVNVGTKGMNFFYNSSFLENLTQREVNFIVLHEDFHLLWDHPKRTITGQYEHRLANIAQDMIINHIIVEDFPDFFVEIPKNEKGENMALFLPLEYEGSLIFEKVYEFLKDKKFEWETKKNSIKIKGSNGIKSEDEDDGDSSDQPSDGDETSKYGPYGKNPRDDNGTIDTYSLDKIFEDFDTNNGQYLDVHMDSEVSDEARDATVREAMDRLKSRGLNGGNVEATLNKLRKKRKDYLSHIRRSISALIFGTKKVKTISRPHRRQIEGLKGRRKVKMKINVILDTSGSMGGQGTFERVLSYVYRNDIEINMIQGDTEVKWVENFKDKKKIESMKINGLGGTILQPSVDYVVQNFNQYNTVMLTDGATDKIDFSMIKGNVLIISVGGMVPILKSNNRVKQILLDETE